jgi:K+-transporting ATPase ATPase A chain
MLGDTRQGWALLAAMTIVFAALLPITYMAEQSGNPVFTKLGADQVASATNPGGNMEGKEVRFGIANSALWATATTAASNGSADARFVRRSGGLIPMWLIQLGEVILAGSDRALTG